MRSTITTGVPRRRDLVEQRRLRVDRRDQDPLHPLLLEQVEVRLLALGALAAVAEHQRQVGGLGGDLDALGDVGEERVAGVEHHVGQGPAGAGAQLPGRLVADEAQLGHGPLDPCPGRRADPVGPVQHVGDRAEGDAGAARRRP